jgi:hypothetical protein
MPKRLTLKEVKNRSRQMGFIFVDNSYEGSSFLHSFKCKIDGEVYRTSFNKINDGRLLPCCAIRKRKDLIAKKKNKVILESLGYGFIFIDSVFHGNTYKHNFKCKIDGKTFKSTFESIKMGHGLWCCKLRKASENQIGNKNINWNSSLTYEDRLNRRHGSFDRKWKNLVKERDDYKCIICFSSINTHAHHLESYGSNKSLRYVVDNGVTLCRIHHQDFHRIFGNSNNTSSQFVEFVCLGIV